ncbi:hypothetical protein F4677DRAFT_404180 [Hypoxylon crocopeplum]|nr:hypothetical protein F4677DRAFT_404180 [Hypoxylon crocopeplum]
MMNSLARALLFTTAICATLRPRQSNDGCCFQLASVGMVNETVLENHVGDLILGGSFQQGGFCLNMTAKAIQDSLGHNCFMRGPDYQFECYQGAVGTTAFNIAPKREDGKSYLTYDNGPGVFYACPIGSASEPVYDIYSDKTNKAECLSIALALVDQTSACSANTPSSTITMASSATVQPTQSLPQVQSQASTPTCSVPTAAPSLAPFRLRPGNSSALYRSNDTAEAAITPQNSTIFDYIIPSNFFPAGTVANSSLCALQFRMPVCTSLPDGYPCYSFSGLEQEVLANSGMAFHLVADGGDVAWNSTEVHQVFPGDNTIIGTFDCGRPVGSYGAVRKMSWQVSSVRDFVLEFLQAGIGQDAEFQDGIGAWIVPCQ